LPAGVRFFFGFGFGLRALMYRMRGAGPAAPGTEYDSAKALHWLIISRA
jgi:hypothetical protein